MLLRCSSPLSLAPILRTRCPRPSSGSFLTPAASNKERQEWWVAPCLGHPALPPTSCLSQGHYQSPIDSRTTSIALFPLPPLCVYFRQYFSLVLIPANQFSTPLQDNQNNLRICII